MSLICRFVMNTGPTPGKEFPLEKAEIFVGRELSNDIVINDGEVSRRHARIFSQAGQYAIEDLGSTNGTFINGERLMGPMILRPGMVVALGEQVSLVFEMVQPPADATIAAPMMRPPVQPAVQAPPIYAPAPQSPVQTPPPGYGAAPQPPVYGQPQPPQPPVYGQPQAPQPPVYGQPQPPPGYPPYPPPQSGYAPSPQAYTPQAPAPGAQTPAYGYYPEAYPPQGPALTGYAGQVPLSPEDEEAPRRKLPNWAVITLIVVGVLLVFCIIALLIIDSSRSNWCALFGSIFNAIQPNTCP